MKLLFTFFIFVSAASQSLAQTTPSAKAMRGFRKFCMACHSHYTDPSAIQSEAAQIFERIKWMQNDNVNIPRNSFVMPHQAMSNLQRQIVLPKNKSIREEMLKAVEPTDITDPAEPVPPTGPEAEMNKLISERLKLPAGFKISLYAVLPGARSIAQGPDGLIFVGTGGFSNALDRVYVLQDKNKNGKIEDSEKRIIAQGLENPNGVAFRKGNLYVAQPTKIIWFPNIISWLENNKTGQLPQRGWKRFSHNFPSGSHSWKFIRFGKAPDDNYLYVPVGYPGNVGREIEGTASIFRFDVDRPNAPLETVAKGVRNTVGFDFHPTKNELWFTDNGRDHTGNRFPPDELNKVSLDKLSKTQHFGFPFCHGPKITPTFNGCADNPRLTCKKAEDPDVNADGSKNCAQFVPAEVALDPHAAALGMRFYTGNKFPQRYRNQVFIAEHGSWNRSGVKFLGYRVSSVIKGRDGKYKYEDFISGWLGADGRSRWGRPVDVEVLKDGSMLISDDGLSRGGPNRGAVYRVEYTR